MNVWQYLWIQVRGSKAKQNILCFWGNNCLKELGSKQLKFEKQYGSNICFAQFESTELNIFEFDRE